MLYEFECKTCNNLQEEIFKVDGCPDEVVCSKCGGKAIKIISCSRIQCDSINDVPWLPSALMTLQPDGERPIETRGEYKQYLKDKGLTASG